MDSSLRLLPYSCVKTIFLYSITVTVYCNSEVVLKEKQSSPTACPYHNGYARIVQIMYYQPLLPLTK